MTCRLLYSMWSGFWNCIKIGNGISFRNCSIYSAETLLNFWYQILFYNPVKTERARAFSETLINKYVKRSILIANCGSRNNGPARLSDSHIYSTHPSICSGQRSPTFCFSHRTRLRLCTKLRYVSGHKSGTCQRVNWTTWTSKLMTGARQTSR